MAAPAPSTLLPAAILLAATGGLLDAIVYLDHGHVFANAMTGNTVLLATALVQQNWFQALRHTVPLCAFLLGIFSARHLKSIAEARHARFVLLLEIVSLFVLALLPPAFPQLLFTGIIAYVYSFQVATFRTVEGFPYNSTFVTGDLREAASGAYDALFAPAPEDRRKGRSQATALAAVSFAFLVGALLGACAARFDPARALWSAEPFLLLTLYLTCRTAP